MFLADLPLQIHHEIISHIDQLDKVQLARTCKQLTSVCRDGLYRNIYITCRSFPLCEARGFFQNDPGAAAALCKWSVVHSGLRELSPVRLLERTLSEHTLPASPLYKIESILCDDITFILFKLNSWNRRFQLTATLHNVYFGNMLQNHFYTAYEDILKFYLRDPYTRLTHLQLTNFNDLTKFLKSSIARLSKLSFHICDISSLDIKPISSSTRTTLRECFQLIESIEIVSHCNLGQNFLESVYEAVKPENENVAIKLFPYCSSVTFNHTHGQARSRDRFNFTTSYESSRERELDADILRKMFDFKRIRSFTVRIGCIHVADDILVHGFPDVDVHCSCLGRFFMDLDMPNLEKLCLTRDGESVNENIYAFFSFRYQVQQAIRKHNYLKLRVLLLATSREMFAFYEYFDKWDDCNMLAIAQKLDQQSLQMLKDIQNLKQLKELHIPDYYQSVHVWSMMKEHNCRPAKSICGCDSCQKAGRLLASFLATNKRIQYYLHPMTEKTNERFYYELIGAVLEILSETSCKDQYAGITNSSQKIGSQFMDGCGYDIMKHVNSDTTSWRKKEVSLHSIFKHDTYKELVNYSYVTTLSRALTDTEERGRFNPYEISCECDGEELGAIVRYIRHQIQESCVMKTTENIGSKVIANSFG